MTPPSSEPDETDAVLLAWRRALAAARLRGHRPGDAPPGRARGAARAVPDTLGRAGSGAAPGPRDPRLIGDVTVEVVADAGWGQRIEVAGVTARWAEVVGPEVAARCSPERFEDGVLVVRAATTSWATQLTFLAGDLARRLAEVVGAGVVTRVEVVGPAVPTWRKGPLRTADSRGSRDTYG